MKTERRAVARYRAKLDVQIDMDEYSIDAASMEVSLRGLRVVCEGLLANKIFSRYLQVTPGENITANILIKIPRQHNLTEALKCHTRIVSVNRVSQSSYVVGFNIINFEGDAVESWQAYIAKRH